ncbi:Uma2 family endonuclease [Altericista sp. CCNU0014]|uniref:Uma2 family endonuclease n=1 Tax=Altericista sp. CCNU0014 TaxID=3082949 RepID=UPI00384D972B
MATVLAAPLSQIQLSPGGSMRVELTWAEYQTLLQELGENRAIRLTYVQGWVEIRMPSKLHELVNRWLERIIVTLTEELGMSVISLGSTRFDRDTVGQGVEPDSCFYIQNADRIDIEAPLPVDLPPDLVVKVDISSSSKSHLEIYGAMGVPEIWRYNPQGFAILQLQAGEYVECDLSLAFPQVSTDFLQALIERGKQVNNQNVVIRELRHSLNHL